MNPDKQARSAANKQAWKNLQGSTRDPESWRQESERLLLQEKDKKKSPKLKSPPQPKPMSAEEKASFWDRMNSLWSEHEKRLKGYHARKRETREVAEKRWLADFVKTLNDEEAEGILQLAARHEARKKQRGAEEAQAVARKIAKAREQGYEYIQAKTPREGKTKSERRNENLEQARTRELESFCEVQTTRMGLAARPELQVPRILEHYGKLVDLVMRLIKLDDPKQLRDGIRYLKRRHAKDFGIELTWKGIPAGHRDEVVLDHYVKATSWVFSVQALEKAGLDSTTQQEVVVHRIRENHLADLGIPLAWDLSASCVPDASELLGALFVFDA